MSPDPTDQPVASVSADGAYDTKSCHDAIAARHACAVIPARRNARAWPESTPGVKARNETFRASRRLGRTIWKRWSVYHQHSRVETKMHCFKLLSERVMAREFDHQVAELQIRAQLCNKAVRSASECYGIDSSSDIITKIVHIELCATSYFSTRYIFSEQLRIRPGTCRHARPRRPAEDES